MIGGHPIVAETLIARGQDTIEKALGFIDPDRYRPAPSSDLPGVEAAVERLIQARRRQEKVCVWGDFDVDGQTSTALLVGCLRALDYTVSYHIPHRERESHGLNVDHLEPIIDEGVSLIVTCDTGIGAVEPAAYARSRGVDIIVTDHHDLPDRMPEAIALVNPKFLPEEHSLRELPGVGVAYHTARRLVQELDADLDPETYLDLVALGIVSDLAIQVKDVRYLLQLGLRQLRKTRRAGLRALMTVAGVEQSFISEEQIGFLLGPRMNALGRLSDAQPSVEFLLGADEGQAISFARKLESLNAERKQLSDAVYASARHKLARDPGLMKGAAIVLADPQWPLGIVGLVAGRLANEFQKPAFLLAEIEGGVSRGSARSVPGIDISKAISAQAEILEGFGGHPMAAGLSIRAEFIDDFRQRVDLTISQIADGTAGAGELMIDAYLPIDSIDLGLIDDLERLAPFGPGNPALLFAAKGLEVIDARPIGKTDEHLLVRVETVGGVEKELVWWNGNDREIPAGRFDLAFHARSSSYKGIRQVQLEWVAAKAHSPLETDLHETSALIVTDCRFLSNPSEALKALDKAGTLIWAEGTRPGPINSSTRVDLQPARELAIWTAPPDIGILRSALRTVKPERVHIFLLDPGYGTLKSFLVGLAGMVKFALNNTRGEINLSAAAAGLAQTERAVIYGIEYLANHGVVSVLERSDEGFVLGGAHDRVSANPPPDARLERSLKETAAFRAFLRKVEPDWYRRLD